MTARLLNFLLQCTYMSRRKRRHYQNPKTKRIPFILSPEAKQGIITVLVFAIAAILFLSFFHVGGNLGVWLNKTLAIVFGIDRYLLPVLFIFIGATFIYPNRGTFSVWNYFGMILFFLSFNAVLNLLLVDTINPLTTNLALAGGYIGQFFATILSPSLGYWGTLVTVVALLFVSVMLVFNTSLRNMIGIHRHITGWFGKRLHNQNKIMLVDLDDEELDEEDELIDEDTFEEDENIKSDQNQKEQPFHTSTLKEQPKKEKILTTHQRRSITIPMSLLEHSTSKAQSGDIERNAERQETL